MSAVAGADACFIGLDNCVDGGGIDQAFFGEHGFERLHARLHIRVAVVVIMVVVMIVVIVRVRLAGHVALLRLKVSCGEGAGGGDVGDRRVF